VSSTWLAEVARLELRMRVFRVCISPTEDVVAVLSAGRGIVVISVPVMHTMATIGGSLHFISVQFDATDGRILASLGSLTGKAHIYDVLSGALLLEFEADDILCYSVDAGLIYGSAGHGDGSIRCWNAETGTEIETHFEHPGISSSGGHRSLFIIAPTSVILMFDRQ
jgi:WD40 repeat protein